MKIEKKDFRCLGEDLMDRLLSMFVAVAEGLFVFVSCFLLVFGIIYGIVVGFTEDISKIMFPGVWAAFGLGLLLFWNCFNKRRSENRK